MHGQRSNTITLLVMRLLGLEVSLPPECPVIQVLPGVVTWHLAQPRKQETCLALTRMQPLYKSECNPNETAALEHILLHRVIGRGLPHVCKRHVIEPCMILW